MNCGSSITLPSLLQVCAEHRRDLHPVEDTEIEILYFKQEVNLVDSDDGSLSSDSEPEIVSTRGFRSRWAPAVKYTAPNLSELMCRRGGLVNKAPIWHFINEFHMSLVLVPLKAVPVFHCSTHSYFRFTTLQSQIFILLDLNVMRCQERRKAAMRSRLVSPAAGQV